jgi:hypothetical protein
MTREEALALYHPVRASVRRILSAAISVCNQSDFMRAAKQLGPWVEGTIALPEGDQAADMLSDIALFEPNQRGRRALDVFLASKARQLDAADSNWPNGWGRHSFLFSGAPGGTGSQEFGSRTNSTEIEPFGSWMKAWRGFVTPAAACWMYVRAVAEGMRKISYAGYRFPPEVIHQAVWLYLRFTLSFRDVEDLLAERGIAVSYETVRRWVNHFGPMITRICASAVRNRTRPGILTKSI